jgi:hypothetical protein
MGSEVDDFLAELLPKQVAAETALRNGDVEPRLALWSRTDPVTVFGARVSGTGWDDVSALFQTVASWFSDSPNSPSRLSRQAPVVTSPTPLAMSTIA